jgi:hypothetical protein
MQTKDFPSVIAVKKSTKPLIEQYKNMMDTEQYAPFIPITAADVTEEVVEVMACYRGYVPTDKEIIAAAVNAYMGAKK